MSDVTPRFKTPKPNPRDLDRAREAVMHRAHGQCEVRWGRRCMGAASAVHHIVRRSQGGSHDPANLLATCTACHDRIHARPADARSLGYLAGMKRSVTDDADLAASLEVP